MMRDRHGLWEGETSKPKNVSATLRRFTGYFRPYWPQYLLVLVLMIVGTWSQVTAPQLLGQAVDCYLTPASVSSAFSQVPEPLRLAMATLSGSESGSATSHCWYDPPQPGWTSQDYLAGLAGLTVRLMGIFLLGTVATGAMFYLMTWSGQHVLKTLRVDVFRQIMRLSIGYHVQHETGDTMSRVTNDADTIQQAITFALVQVLSGAMLILWVSYVMFKLSAPYALVALSILPFMIAATVWFSGQARRAFRRSRQEMGSVNAELQESISGVRESQAFGREDENIAAFRQVNASNRDANIRAVAFTSALSPTLEALGYVSLMLVTVVGGIGLLRGAGLLGSAISLGMIITFIAYVQRFNQPVQMIAVMWTNIQSAVAGGERIFGLLDVVPDVRDATSAVPLPPIRGTVVFDDVWAEYEKGVSVLKGIQLEALPGQTTAIVGPTGAGKTTIINLIPRFYDVTRGRVTIDGHDVRDVTAASLRRQIGVVLQDNFLFSASIMENLRFGRPEATDEEVVASARLAHADTFIQRLPEGYQTVLGERGAGLSQGQRQLLAIARAALADPRILILDEATSSVDTRTERLIQSALETLMRGRTSFVVAHRLSTIRNADQVLVLQDGQIVERGRHESLLALQGVYHQLYMSQFRRQAETTGPPPSGLAAAPA